MASINKNKLGLTIGIFAALVHLIWSIAAAFKIQAAVNWMFMIHSLQLGLTVVSAGILNAIILIVLAFIGGYIFGWVFAAIWNLVDKKVR